MLRRIIHRTAALYMTVLQCFSLDRSLYYHRRAWPRSSSETSEPGTRERIVAASSELFRHRGYAGTGLKAILAASRAPYGSLYHFFPGGKEELGVAALQAGGVTYRELVELFFPDGRRRRRRDAARSSPVPREHARGDRLRRRVPDRDDGARGRERERTDAPRVRGSVRVVARGLGAALHRRRYGRGPRPRGRRRAVLPHRRRVPAVPRDAHDRSAGDHRPHRGARGRRRCSPAQTCISLLVRPLLAQ